MNRDRLKELNKKYGDNLFFQFYLREELKKSNNSKVAVFQQEGVNDELCHAFLQK